MPIGAGWDSPGARLRTERFQRRREEVVSGLGPMLAEGLESATTATDQSLIELASNQGMFNLGRPTVGPAPAPLPLPPSPTPTPVRPPAFGLRGPRVEAPPPTFELAAPTIGTPPLRALAEGFATPRDFGAAPLSSFAEIEETRLRRGGEAAREFGEAIQGMPLPEVALLGAIAQVAQEEGLTPQQLVAQPRLTEFEQEALRQRIETAAIPILEGLAPAPGALRTAVALALTPLAGGPPGANPLERVGDVPFVGEALQRELEFLTSPAGLVTAGAFPTAMGAGAVGGVALGAEAGAAADIGLLPSGTVDVPGLGELGAAEIGQIIGNLAPPALLTGPGRAATGAARRAVRGVPREVVETAPPVPARAAGEAAVSARAIEDVVIDEQRQIHRLAGDGGQLDYRLTPEGAHLMDINAPGRGQEFFDELRNRVPGTITGDLNTEAGALLFARQPGAQFTEFPSGRAITPDEAVAQAGAGRGPRAEVPGAPPGTAPVRAAGQVAEEAAPRLETVADDAARAAGEGLPAVAGGETIGLASPRTLKTVAEIADDARRSTQNAFGALTRGAARFGPTRALADFVNPSALIDSPPAGVVDELGEEAASQLQANLVAHARQMDQGSAIASAIEEGIGHRARAVGLDVEDGLVVSVKGSPPVGDLFENPSRYSLTSDQRRLVDEVQAVLNDMNAVEQAAGVKKGLLFSGEGRYFPRLVREVRGVENQRAQVRRIVGGKQGFTRERFYETMQEGMDAGVRYEDDIGAIVGTRIRAGMKATSDESLAQLIRPLGRTLKAPRTTVGIGETGTMVPALGGRAFPPQTGRAIMDALNPAPPGSTLRFTDALNSVLRPIQATGELSFWGIQMMASIFRNPAAFARGALYSLDGLLLDGRMYGRYMQNNADWINRFVRGNGVWNSSEFTFDQAVKSKTIRAVFGRIGVKGALGRFDQAFNQGLNVTALENFKGMVGLGDSVGFDAFNRAIRRGLGDFAGETADEVAASIASKMTGRLPVRGLGVKATQRSVESTLAFAPRYYRAMFGLLGDAIQGGMRGAEARRVLGSLFAGALATHVAVAHALGQEPNLDPRNSNFLTVRVGGTKVGIGGPIYGLARMLAESAENPDKLKSANMNNPLVRWARGRAAPILSLATDLVTQETFMGKKIDSAGDLFREIATTPLPFIAQQTIEEGPESFPAQFLGLRAFPESAFDQFRRDRDAGAQELFGKPYGDLNQIEKAQVDAMPQVEAAQQRLRDMPGRDDLVSRGWDELDTFRESQNQEQLQDDAALEAGTMEPGMWRQRHADRETRFFERREAIADFAGLEFKPRDADEGTVDAAINAFFAVKYEDYVDSLTGETDWSAFDEAQDEALASLSERDRQSFEELVLGKHDTPMERRYRTEGKRLRDELGDIPQFRGISVERKREIDAFLRRVRGIRDRIKDERGPDSPDIPTMQEAIERAGQALGYDSRFILEARALASSSARQRLLNLDYVRFIVENADQLLYFYPELRTDAIRRVLAAE